MKNIFLTLMLMSFKSLADCSNSDFRTFEACMSSAQCEAEKNKEFTYLKYFESFHPVAHQLMTTGFSHYFYRKDNGMFAQRGYNCTKDVVASELDSLKSIDRNNLRSNTKVCGSVIDYVKKTVIETIPITGTEFALNYSSEFNSKIEANRNLSRNYRSYILNDPGRYKTWVYSKNNLLFKFEYPLGSKIEFNWIWDGISGNLSTNNFVSKLDAEVKLTTAITVVNSSSTCDITKNYCDPNTISYSGLEVDLTKALDLDSLVLYHPEVWGLNGWVVNQHHYFDIGSKTLFSGSGEKIYYSNYKKKTLPNYGLVYIVNKKDSANELYVFDSDGKHLETRTGLTFAVKYKFNYDSQNRITGIVDINNKMTEFIYDSSGSLLKIKAPYGQETIFAVNQSNIESVTLPAGSKYDMKYDSRNLLIEFAKPDKEKTIFTYADNGNFLKEEKNSGLYQEFTKSVSDFVNTFQHLVGYGISQKNDLIMTSEYTSSTIKNANDEVIYNQTDYASNKKTTFSTNDTLINILRNNHPVWGEDFKIVNTISKVYSFSQNTINEVSQLAQLYYYTNNDDPFSLYKIDKTWNNNAFYNNSVLSIDIKNKKITSLDYNRRYSFIYFNDKEQITRIEPATSVPTDFQYNSDGKLVKIVKGNQQQIFTYSLDGFLSSETNSENKKTLFYRNSIGQLLSKTFPNGDEVKFEYTAAGSLKKIATPSKQVHTFDYGIGDYLLGILNPVNKMTQYDYDSDKRLIKLTKPSGNKISFNYKSQSNVLDSIQTERGKYLFSNIDSQGRLKEVISADQIKTQFSWVSDKMLGQKMYDSDGSVIAEISYSYYPNSLRVKNILLNNVPIANYGYSASSDKLENLNGNIYTYSYEQGSFFKDKLNVLDSKYGFSLDYVNQESSIDTKADLITSGRITTDPNLQLFVNVKRSFNSNSQATSYSTTTLKNNNNVINSVFQLTPQYDDNGRLIQIQKNSQNYVNSQVVSKTDFYNNYIYGLNSNNNIKGFNQQLGSNSDPIKNIVFSYSADDKLLSSKGSINRNYTYDDDGNLKAMTNCYGTTSYQYDDFSNLIQITKPNGTVIDYKVDGLNRRVKKIVNGNVQEYYLWYDQTHIAAILNSDKTVRLVYLYGPESNSPSYIIKNNVTYRIVHDPGLGSIRYVVNPQTSQIVQEIEYDEFGNMMKNTNADFQPLSFAGGLSDPDTKFIRFGARDYDPTIGRWTTKDPIGFMGGTTNLYEYSKSNPMSFTDPSGLSPGDKFKTPAEAAVDALGSINSTSIKTDIEYAGTVYKNADGTYSATSPIKGGEGYSHPGTIDINTVGMYHTHGMDDGMGVYENFSSGDIQAALNRMMNSYLGTPRGEYKVYDPKNGSTTSIKRKTCP